MDKENCDLKIPNDDIKKKLEEENFFNETDTEHYDKAKNYWSNISPTVDGMLGGFGKISFADIRGSQSFLQLLYRLKPTPGRDYALDCGAGIGRVTKHLLMPMFVHVDMVEQDKQFCDIARSFVTENKPDSFTGEIFNVGLQDFNPTEAKYDLIWNQWVLGHLTDTHLIEFLERCQMGLRKNGIIVMKENFTSTGEIEIDYTDNSVTRPLSLMRILVKKSGLRIIKEQRQNNFPKGLFPVYIIALKSTNRKN